MNSKSEVVDLKRYLPHVLVVTFVIAALPLLAVFSVERLVGVSSNLVTGALGVVFSLVVAVAGSALWRKFGTSDLVFADLLLWGYLRRVWVDRRLAQATHHYRLHRDPSVIDRMTPEARAKMLSDLAAMIEASDPYTRGHSSRVTRHAYMIAKTMGLPKEIVDKVRLAATVHDIGKIHTPKQILHKPSRLTDEEFEVIKKHPVIGAEMVAVLGDAEVAEMVRHHHERLDGRGYPNGLRGEDIPIGARVIAVADTFDAICSTRPYRPASRHMKAIEIMKKEAGKQLDSGAVQAFLRYYSGRSSLGWWATLSTVPQRVVSQLLTWMQQTAAGAAVQGASAVVATAALVAGVPVATTVANIQVAVAEERAVRSASPAQSSETLPSDQSNEPVLKPTPGPDYFAPGPSSSDSETEPAPDTSPTAEPGEGTPTESPEPEPSPSPTNGEPDLLDPLPSPSPSPTSILDELVDEVLDFLF